MSYANYNICPICGSPTTYVDIPHLVRDANSIYQCTKYKEHRFWTHPFSSNTMHLNSKVHDVTDWHSERDFRWEHDQWKRYLDPKNMEYAVFGSIDSDDLDVMYFLDELPSLQECKVTANEIQLYHKSDKPVDVNFCVVKDKRVVNTYKGTIDEVNNMLYYTTSRHKQKSNFPEIVPVTRDTHLKTARVIRGILSFISRTEYRTIVKQALKGDGKLKLDTLETIKLTEIKNLATKNKTIKDFYKLFAFQIGQAMGLMNGSEYYSKSSIAAHYPELKPYLYKESDNFPHIDEIKQQFINKVRETINVDDIKE